MVIQLQKGSLGPALQNLGTILGKALEQRGKKLQEDRVLESVFGAPQPVSSIAQQRASSSQMNKRGDAVPMEVEQENILDRSSATPGIQRISDEQLTQLTLLPKWKPYADAELKRRELKQRSFEADRTFNAKGAQEAEKKASALRDSLPRKQMALTMAKEAIQSGEVGRASLANLAERTGIKEFQTAKGVQLITASKENLLSNMARVSAKAQNQWFEQRLNSMFPQIGQSAEANMTAQTMLEGELRMDQNYLNAYNRLAEEDENKYGYIRKDIDKRAAEESDKLNKEILDETSYKLRSIYDEEKGYNWLKRNAKKSVPKGTYLTPRMYQVLLSEYGSAAKTIENAKKLGYSIPTREEAEAWQN